MDQKTLIGQAIRYQKVITESSFSLLSVVQHSSTEMLKQSLDYYSWLPASSKKDCLFWSQRCIQATEQLRSMLEKGFDEAEKQLSASSFEPVKPKSASEPSSSARRPVKAPVRKTTSPEPAPVKSAKTEVDKAPEDSAAVSLEKPSQAPSSVKRAPKAATKTKSTAARTKSTTTRTKSAAARKTSAKKSKSSGVTSSSAAATKGTENPKTAAVKKATAKTTAPPAKQSN